MADVPRELLDEIKRLEEMFTVETPKLKEIADKFAEEMLKGEKH